MPQVTVYIRKADMPKWKAIPKKTEFISKALQGFSVPPDWVEVRSGIKQFPKEGGITYAPIE